MTMVKNISQLFLLFFVLLPITAFGKVDMDSNTKTLLHIKMYFEPNKDKKKLLYKLILPKNEYYSYYLGSDLPTWQFVNKNIIQGEFYPVELVNIRIHSRDDKFEINKKAGNNKVYLTLKDAQSSRIIWEGELRYANKNNIITAVTKIDDQEHYDTKLKFENAEKTVWLETTDR